MRKQNEGADDQQVYCPNDDLEKGVGNEVGLVEVEICLPSFV